MEAFREAQCGGTEACREAHIVSDNDAVYGTATHACSEATIVANNADVVCSAEGSLSSILKLPIPADGRP